MGFEWQRKNPGRRSRAFLAGIGAAGAATAAAAAATPATPRGAHAGATRCRPSRNPCGDGRQIEEAHPGATVDSLHIAAAGSDYMVDVLMALGYTYVAATPGTTFRGLQESVINHAIAR